MAYEAIICGKRGKIGYITFNRPDACNAANEQMLPELKLAVDEIEADTGRCWHSSPVDDALEYCQKDAMMTILTQDVDEGTRALVEKRSPVWQGRWWTDWHCVSEAGKSYCLPKW